MEKIIIIGNGGSGKSTFADQLGKKLNKPVLHLDTLHWKSETEIISTEEFDVSLKKELNKKEWIIDGNYKRTLAVRTRYADTIIFLDYPKAISLWRAIKRYLQQKFGQYHLKSGNPAILRWEFIWWILTFPREFIFNTVQNNMQKNATFIVLHSPQETQYFLKNL